ncbi:unnamed protein product [Plutella xylostella]|uniref:(diamondback moth) hypothetical protein n=1 Tax=Plutella xylostella TaxID=51655 RepID=A0A8S4FWK2_PLUXY|nr:unnamed protein product [Plutella xylostella]
MHKGSTRESQVQALAHTLQGLGQDEGMYQQYIPLALHLADELFLTHPSRDVQLLIACCIADVLRVYAPEAPYKDQEQVKTIFLFLINQLQGLRDPKDPAFKRYFYLLENLAYVKSFNMCFELEDCQEIFCALFALMFKIVNGEHSNKVKSFMLDVLCPLITESDVVSNELLNVLLTNLVEPHKRERKHAYALAKELLGKTSDTLEPYIQAVVRVILLQHAYALAKELLGKTSDTLEPYIQAFFNHVLILGKEEKNLLIFSKVYELIYELNQCCPSILTSVLPQLECKLKSAQLQERLSAVALLARMFSEPQSTLAKQYPALWRAFLGRFNDISVHIRIKCVQYCMHFLVHHPDLRQDITETLKLRQHDAHEQVRYEVVMAIIATVQRDFKAVAESEDLLHFVKERTLDKKFKIRKEAMSGLAMIYRKFLTEESVPPATEKAVRWIKDKILHGYYMTALEDRLLVERLLNTSLVPYTLPAPFRMKKLYYLMTNIDDNATKAFIELQKHQLAVRRTVAEWIELHRKPPTPAVQKELMSKVLHISTKFLPDSVKAQEFLTKFSQHMKQAPELLQGMETILNPNVSCEVCVRTTSSVLKKLGQPVMTNVYYNTIKMLLERVSSVMIDRDSLLILVGYVHGAATRTDTSIANECGIDIETAATRGLKLLVMLSFVFPAHFLHEDVLNELTSLLELDDESVAPYILAALTFLGKYRPLNKRHYRVLRRTWIVVYMMMLSFVFPAHFLHEDVLNELTSLLELDDESVAPYILAALTFLGKYRPLNKRHYRVLRRTWIVVYMMMLSFVFPAHFLHEDVLNELTSLLELDDESVAPYILAALTFLGKYRPLNKRHYRVLRRTWIVVYMMMLSFVFPAHFLHEDVLNELTSLLELDDESVAPYILAALTFLGKYRPLSEVCPALFPRLITLCKAYAEVGTPKQAKNAVRCLYVNVPEERVALFTSLLETLKATLTPASEHYRTAIVTLGHVAHNLPAAFPVLVKNIVSRKEGRQHHRTAIVTLGHVAHNLPAAFPVLVNNIVSRKEGRQHHRTAIVTLGHVAHNLPAAFPVLVKNIVSRKEGRQHHRTAIVTLGHVAHNLPAAFPVLVKNIVSRKIVKELLVREGGGGPNAPTGDWCPEEELPEETRCKLEGLKCMARWLLGLKRDELSAQKTFRMLNAFIVHKGDLLQQNQLSPAEKAHLRLAAGAAMLKICEQKGVGDQFTAEQFYNLSHLMVDEVPQVREIFASKLHKGLSKGIPNKCLPLDFMGMYALCGREPERRLRAAARQYMLADVLRRRDYIRNISVGTKVERAVSQLPHIMPDYMLVFAVPVLAHDPAFDSYDNVAHLKIVKQCLWFILEPLITRNEMYCYGFYKNLIERMKLHKDALCESDDAVNYKLWATCDLAMTVIWSRSSSFELREFPADARVPTMYYSPQPEHFHNTRVFLPPELQYQPKKTTAQIEPATRGKKRTRPAGNSENNSNDVEPSEASDTQIQLPGLEQAPETELDEPQAKRTLSE